MYQDSSQESGLSSSSSRAKLTPQHPNKTPVRRALGELTNTPLLLSPGHSNGRLLTSSSALHSPSNLRSPSSHNVATPPKAGNGQCPATPDTVTPTHNLKLLTELASKMPSSSARQTLQFEDMDSGKYKHREPMFLPSSHTETGEAPSPHRDHPYGVKNGSTTPPPPSSSAGATETSVMSSHDQLPSNQNRASHKFREEFVVVTPVEQSRKTTLKPTKTVSANELFTPPSSANQSPVLTPRDRLSANQNSAEKAGNRKEKSLGLLAERMLAGLPETVSSGQTLELQLDDTARVLATERRRIYDIVNVFEAVQIMSKVGKNVYQWHGRTFLVQSLAWLRQLALKLNMDEQYRVAREQDIQMMIHNQENINIENVSPAMSPMTPTFSPMASPSPINSPYNSPNDPNGTSMGINTQKFLMLFLVTPAPKTLTLEFAAKVIHGSHQGEKTRLTKIRRLYDIANILQSLGLIRKVQVTDGRGKKPAFQFVGPDVSNMTLTEEEKRLMPATRQKNSLLAVGRNLVLEEPQSGAKRARSEERKACDNQPGPAKLLRTRSESRVPTGNSSTTSAGSLFDLSEVCERERKKMEDTAQDQENVPVMKPPTPGRPPSRKKHLLARYYSDSALLSTSTPRAISKDEGVGGAAVSVTKIVGDNSGHNFTRPRQYSPAQISAVPQQSPRVPPQSPRPSYSPLHPSPLTKQPSNTGLADQKQYTPLRSPVTPRDLRNSAILPPNSPQRSKMITASPMGPVGRSLLSSPASPRAPIDLTTRPGLGRSPLASRSLNLPPTPTSPDCVSNIKMTNEGSSPLLRAYLANNKNRIFKPIMNCVEEGVSILPLESDTSSAMTAMLSPSTTISALSLTNSPCSSSVSSPPPTSSPDGSTNSSSASELEGIFGGKPLPRPCITLAKNPRPLATDNNDTPLDFSGLISAPPKSSASVSSSPFSIMSLTSPFLNHPRDLTTPHIELAPSFQPPPAPAKKAN